MVKKRISKEIVKIVKNYTERISKENKIPIKKVIVFGSSAKGSSQKWSDIDVCIVSPRFKNIQKTLEFLWMKREREEVLKGLEPIGFSLKDFNQGSALINEIKETGVLIK